MRETDSRRIPPFFNPRSVGEALKEVDVRFLPNEKINLTSRWFHGPQDADIFIWTDEKDRVVKQQIGFCGQVVEWNVVEGLRTGLIVEKEAGSHNLPASEIIQYDNSAQKPAIQMAIELVLHVTALEGSLRQEVLGHLERPESLASTDPEEFVRRYGAQKQSQSSQKSWRSRLLKAFQKIFK